MIKNLDMQVYFRCIPKNKKKINKYKFNKKRNLLTPL